MSRRAAWLALLIFLDARGVVARCILVGGHHEYQFDFPVRIKHTTRNT